MTRLALVLSTVILLSAQGTKPKNHPADYPVHVQLEALTVAGEYLVHTIPNAKATLIANDYLVVEAAFYGPRFSRLKMSPDNFSLRLNGKGNPLPSEPYGLVAQSIKFPGIHPHLEATGSLSAGDGTIVIGPRPPQSRFPGDGNDRLPPNLAPTITEVNEENDIEYRVRHASLPEGEYTLPISGLVYFYYRGSTKDIHSIELLYNGTMGQTTLKLLP
jgi:hypothetical protein